MVGGEFRQVLENYYHSWLPARQLVVNALQRRFEVDPSGKIMVLDRYCPWTSHLFDLEEGAL